MTLRRHAESLDSLTPEEDAEYIQVRNGLTRSQMQALGARVIHVSCLMNEAFQQAQPALHVHYHSKPHYLRPVTIDDDVFADRQFGEYIRNKQPHPVSIPTGKKIVGAMKEHL